MVQLQALLAPLSNMWLGTGLLAILCIDCSIRSLGVLTSFAFWEPTALYPRSEVPLLEMTEYEWPPLFHTPLQVAASQYRISDSWHRHHNTVFCRAHWDS